MEYDYSADDSTKEKMIVTAIDDLYAKIAALRADMPPPAIQPVTSTVDPSVQQELDTTMAETEQSLVEQGATPEGAAAQVVEETDGKPVSE